MKTKEQAIEALKKVIDPELNLDIYTLGLIYDIEIKDNLPKIKMTFTSPTCPYVPQLVADVESQLQQAGFDKPEMEYTFNPPWEPSEEVKMMLGLA